MDGAQKQDEHEATSPPHMCGRIGVLLVNLGTPDAPTTPAIRRYLAEFLSDPRIVDLPRLLWLPILHGVILPMRSKATALNYKKIWREDGDSPLRYYTRQQANAVSELCDDKMRVDWAMRYGTPAIADRLRALKEKGCDRVLILPLYPQYSLTTTASVMDAVQSATRAMGWHPELRIIDTFHDEPAYIDALAAVTRRRLDALDWAPAHVLISFHGLPQRYVDAGDPYLEHCTRTAELLRTAMRWADDFAPMTFQSKFGRAKWLTPSTQDTLESLAGQGVKNTAVITPGFIADCIETLEEIAITAQETFKASGGEQLAAIPCLNHEPEMISLLKFMIQRETASWL